MLPRIEHKEQHPEVSIFSTEPDTLDVPVPPKVSFHREKALDLIILEIQARDSFGLLYKLTRAITHAGLDIVFVRLSTENSVAMDTFHIVRKEGDKKIKDEELNSLQKTLERIVVGQEGEEVSNEKAALSDLFGEGI